MRRLRSTGLAPSGSCREHTDICQTTSTHRVAHKHRMLRRDIHIEVRWKPSKRLLSVSEDLFIPPASQGVFSLFSEPSDHRCLSHTRMMFSSRSKHLLYILVYIDSIFTCGRTSSQDMGQIAGAELRFCGGQMNQRRVVLTLSNRCWS
jgi:hypothetical protein